MNKQEILDALDLAIADHKAVAGSAVDWGFVAALRAAGRIVDAAPEVMIPRAIANEATA